MDYSVNVDVTGLLESWHHLIFIFSGNLDLTQNWVSKQEQRTAEKEEELCRYSVEDSSDKDNLQHSWEI